MENKQINLVLVTLLSMGKTFYFKTEDDSLLKDELVICETTRGIEIGKVYSEVISKEVNEEANIVAIDYDPGATKVNQENRIKLMLSIAKEKLPVEVWL